MRLFLTNILIIQAGKCTNIKHFRNLLKTAIINTNISDYLPKKAM